MNYYKMRAHKYEDGWLHLLLLKLEKFKMIAPLFGSRTAALDWDGTNWKKMKKKAKCCLLQRSIEQLKNSLRTGKHRWLLEALPTYETPRPFDRMVGSCLRHKTLAKWLISEHDLEVETGRYKRLPREQRHCKQCLQKQNWTVVQDEYHLYGVQENGMECCIAEVERVIAKHEIEEILAKEKVREDELCCLQESFKYLHKLDKKNNTIAWGSIADFIIAVAKEMDPEG